MTDDLNPLVPLTPEQQEEFERRRETAVAIQSKCTSCGQWYETQKRSQGFKERFFCDCGTFIIIDVPPLSTAGAVAAIDYSDPDARLDTGMKVQEAITLTQRWWNGTGRHLMKKDGPKGESQAVTLDPGDDNFIPSGILNGVPWDELSQRERLTIVKHWHHFHVRKPQQL